MDWLVAVHIVDQELFVASRDQSQMTLSLPIMQMKGRDILRIFESKALKKLVKASLLQSFDIVNNVAGDG